MQTLQRIQILRMVMESGGLYFQSAAHDEFESRGVELDVIQPRFAQQTFDPSKIYVGLFKRLLEPAIQWDAGNGAQRVCNGDCQRIQEPNQWRLIFIHLSEVARKRCDRIIENNTDDASLFIAEERTKRKGASMELFIKNADNRASVRLRERVI